MALRADQTYSGHIRSAAAVFSGSGTPGIQINLECQDGKISHTFWLTEKTVKRVEKTLTEIGCRSEDLYNENGLDNIDEILADREVSFTTVSEEYKGDTRIKVQWVNKPRGDSNGKTAASAAASLFSGKKLEAPVAAPAQRPAPSSAPMLPELTDDDVPF